MPASSSEHVGETFTTIEAVNRWLKAQGEASSAPDLQRLRAAVLVLAKNPKPKKEDVFPMCSSWNVRRQEQKKNRPQATLIAELQQAVITQGNRLRRSLDALTGASASSAAQVADPPLASGAASSVEQPAATGTAAEMTVKRPIEAAIAAQPGRRSKAPRKGASSASASAVLTEALQTRDEDLGEACHPPRAHDDVSAAQPGPKSKQRRLTAMFPTFDNQQAGAAASSSVTPPGFNEINIRAAQPAPPTKKQCLAPAQHSILEYGSSPDDLAELRRAMGHMVKELMRLKDRTAASDDGFEMLTQLLARVKQLQQIPGAHRTLR